MASPNYDSLSVQHSRNIGDAVSSASSDGNQATSAMRDIHLNNAIKKFVQIKYLAKDYSCISRYVNETSATALTSNVLSLSGLTPACAWIISVTNTTAGLPVREIPQELVDYVSVASTTNDFIKSSSTNQQHVREGVNVRVLGSGATDSVKIRYVAQHTTLSAGGSSDIIIDSQYWNIILELAKQEFYTDFPNEENALKLKNSLDMLKMLIG